MHMRYTFLLRFSGLIVGLFAIPNTAVAQTTAALTISGGTATDQLGRGSSALALSPRVALALGPAASILVSGSATRFASDAWSLGGGTELAARQRLGRFAALTLNGSVNG